MAEIKQIKAVTRPSKHADLPVDVLLLTVKDCEFLACYSELKNPYRCYFDDLGYAVYFSDVSESQEEVKVALLRLCTCKHKRTRNEKIRKRSFLPHAFSIRRSFASLVFRTLSCLASSTASFNSNACHVSSLLRPSMLLLGALGVMGRMHCATEPRNEAAVSSNSGRSFQA